MSMNTKLTADVLSEFKNRFGDFHDATILSFFYKPRTRNELEELLITFSVRDWRDKDTYTWIKLVLKFEDIYKIIMRRTPKYRFDTIFHLNIGFIDGKIHMDFFRTIADELNSDNYEEIPNKKTPDLIIVSEYCSWSIASEEME